MSPLIVAILAFTVLVDVGAQLCFKAGLSGTNRYGEGSLWLKVTTTPIIWAGIIAYAAELAAWVFILSRLPLNAAFPLTSLSYCGIALTGRFILKEPVSTRRWIGIALISIGAAIVGSTT